MGPSVGRFVVGRLASLTKSLARAGSAQAKEEAMRRPASWRVAADDTAPNQEELCARLRAA